MYSSGEMELLRSKEAAAAAENVALAEKLEKLQQECQVSECMIFCFLISHTYTVCSCKNTDREAQILRPFHKYTTSAQMDAQRVGWCSGSRLPAGTCDREHDTF